MASNVTTGTRVKAHVLKPSSLPANTASLSETVGVPGWQIVHNGDLPVVTLSDGGQSIIGYGGVQTLSAAPTRSTTSQTHNTSGLNKNLTIIIIIVSITILIFTSLLTGYIFIRRTRKRREKNFEVHTMELKRKSQLWESQSKPPHKD